MKLNLLLMKIGRFEAKFLLNNYEMTSLIMYDYSIVYHFTTSVLWQSLWAIARNVVIKRNKTV